jgi:hypothetical protein
VRHAGPVGTATVGGGVIGNTPSFGVGIQGSIPCPPATRTSPVRRRGAPQTPCRGVGRAVGQEWPAGCPDRATWVGWGVSSARCGRLVAPTGRCGPAAEDGGAVRRGRGADSVQPWQHARSVRPWPLAAYVYTRDLGRALQVAERVDAGMVGINRGFIQTPLRRSVASSRSAWAVRAGMRASSSSSRPSTSPSTGTREEAGSRRHPTTAPVRDGVGHLAGAFPSAADVRPRAGSARAAQRSGIRGITVTGTWLWWISELATLPRTSLDTGPSPREPITMRSAPRSSATSSSAVRGSPSAITDS